MNMEFVKVQSAWVSKINWTQFLSASMVLLAAFGLPLSQGQQVAILTFIGVVGWAWWAKQKSATIGDNALISVSGGYKSLSDSQQARIVQQDKFIAELQSQLIAAQTEIERLRELIGNMRCAKASTDAATLRTLANSEGG